MPLVLPDIFFNVTYHLENKPFIIIIIIKSENYNSNMWWGYITFFYGTGYEKMIRNEKTMKKYNNWEIEAQLQAIIVFRGIHEL